MPQPKIAIIPGNANNLTCDFGILKVRAEDWQFLPYKNCPQLVWGDDRNFGILQSLNPFAYLANYLHEKTQIENPIFILRLKEFLEHHNPEVLVCHSMGCLFLANYLQDNSLPSSVRKIILLQGDVCQSTEFRTSVPIISSYCYWDYTLWVSVILNRYLPIGLVGSKKIRNQFLFLFTPNNETNQYLEVH